MPCSGDASQICGGNKAINIFEYQDQEQDGFVGCFLDSFDRVLSGEEFSDPDMTTDVRITYGGRTAVEWGV